MSGLGASCLIHGKENTPRRSSLICSMQNPYTKVRDPHAEVVKLVDTLASGASGGNPVEVQVLSSAPTKKYPLSEPHYS